MEIYIKIIIFILGLLIGSFLNVCTYRIPRGESIAFPPSHCPNCNTKIRPYDLIPVLSYILLRGKCRNCKTKISIKYPILEFFIGLMFLLIYNVYGLSFNFIKFTVFTSFIVIIGVIDYNSKEVYSITTYGGSLLGLVFLIIKYFKGENILTYLYGAAIGGGVIYLIILIGQVIYKQEAMGFGDLEICVLSGLFLGFSNTVLMLLISFVLGGALGSILLVTKLKERKDEIAFGPYLSIAAVIAMLYGDEIINLYLKYFLNI